MNQYALHLQLNNPDQGRIAVREQLLPFCGRLIEAGKRVSIKAEELQDDRTLRQNAFYWGPCLKDISEQASIAGQKYSKDAWHELFKREFLPRKVTKAKVAGRKKTVVSVSLGSTAALSVRQMSKYLDQLQAFAATELGVIFTVRDWEQYRT